MSAMNDAPLDFDAVRSRARGSWPGILAALGIEVPFNRHSPCPGCGGIDRFRFDDKDGRGTWICSGGGADLLAGDGFALVQHVRGCGALEAFREVAAVLGGEMLRGRRTEPRRYPPPAPDPGRRAYALELWVRADRDDAAVAAHAYVERKGFTAAHGAGVVDGVRCQQWDGEHRCLLVPIRAHGTGKVIAVQAINGTGQKATFGSMTAEDGTPGYLLLGNDLDPACRLYVVEGWADAVSLVFLSYRGNAAAAIAFGKSRLEKVALQVQADVGRVTAIVEDSE